MLSRNHRVSNQRLITKLNKGGKAYKTAHFVFKYLPSHSESSRFTAVISTKTIPKAVKRNRARRQITESLRLNMSFLKKPIVCLVILKKGVPETLDYSIIDSEIKAFFHKINTYV